MATLVDSVVSEARALLGDPAARRVSFDNWITFYNRAGRAAAYKFNAINTIAKFDVLAQTPQYLFPEDMVQMRKLEYNSTGDDISWRVIKEIFEDQFRQRTNWTMPTGEPVEYLAAGDYFQLVPMPSQTVLLGGRITYWRVPAEITSIGGSTAGVGTVMEFPDFMRSYITDSMVINAKQKLYMYEEAQQDLRMLALQEPEIAEKLEDRSADKRSRLRPVGADNPYGGMA